MKSVTTKTVALLCAVVLLLALAACGESGGSTDPQSSSNPIVGSWEHSSGYTYTFNDNGTGTYSLAAGGASGEMKFTYELKDNNILSLLYDGNTAPMELEYEINGTVLNVKDSFGNDTLYNRK